MNHVEYLVKKIKREIPLPLLKKIFVDDPTRPLGMPITLDAILTTDIIYDVLLMEMNVMAGKEEVINVRSCPIKQTTTGQIIEVGYGPTNGKEIMSVLDVGYGYNTAYNSRATIASAVSDPMITGDAKVQLVGKNVVYMDGYVGINISTMRVVLEHDKNLNETNPRALPFLAELAVLATKQHLYTQGMIRLKNAVVNDGVDLPYLESVLESYSDATSMLNDKLKEYHVVALVGDRTAYTRHLRSILPF